MNNKLILPATILFAILILLITWIRVEMTNQLVPLWMILLLSFTSCLLLVILSELFCYQQAFPSTDTLYIYSRFIKKQIAEVSCSSPSK